MNRLLNWLFGKPMTCPECFGNKVIYFNWHPHYGYLECETCSTCKGIGKIRVK